MSVGRRALLIGAGASFALPLPVDTTITAATAGGWQGLTGSNAVQYNGVLYFGWIDADGDVRVGSIDEATLTTAASGTLRDWTTSVDWHNSPGIAIRDDGRIVVAYTGHNVNAFYFRVSTNPEDVTSFGAEANIDSQLGGSSYTYPWLFAVGSTLHLFYRDGSAAPGTNPDWCESVSTDGGTTWSAQQSLWNAATTHPSYFNVDYADGRWDFAATDATTDADNASVYHFYREGSTYHKSDGTVITGPPFAPADVTLVHSGGSGGARYPGAIRAGANPVIAWPEFSGATKDYYWARWSGSSWSPEFVVADGSSGEAWVEGGITMEYADPATVWLSRFAAGKYDVWRYIRDGGAWTGTQISASPSDDFYPVAVRDAVRFRAIWLRGTASSELSYSLGIEGASR